MRRGHGDLHLGNIVLIDERPVLFDAIEFDPLIAAGDVLYDLAFLLMDLCERGLSQAANIVLNRYLIETRRIDDLDGLAALPFFLSLRAAIRAKVTAARMQRVKATEQARSRAGPAPISPSPGARLNRRRRNSLLSAASPAPEKQSSRARWRRTSRRCPAPSSCARTSSARR